MILPLLALKRQKSAVVKRIC